MCGKRKHQFVSPSTVRSVHKILRSAFEQAVKWELMEKNPCIYATLPKYTSKKRDIWTAETLFRALKFVMIRSCGCASTSRSPAPCVWANCSA